MALIDTSPAVIEVGLGEAPLLGFDSTNYQTTTSDTSVTSPATTLTDISLNPPVSVPAGLSGSPTVSGNVIKQRVLGSALIAGHSYYLIVTYTGQPSGNVWEMRLRIDCPAGS